MKRLLFLTLIFLLPSLATTAQDTTETPGAGWHIEQRCVGKPTPPPKDWTYDGTILMSGKYGVHGIQSDWAVPRVVTFVPYQSWGNFDNALSPDGKWYAFVKAKSYPGSLWVDHYIYEIDVYSTTELRKVYRIPWTSHMFVGTQGGFRQIRWWNNEYLVFESVSNPDEPPLFKREDTFLINAFTGEKRTWQGKTDPLYSYRHYDFTPSPDWTRALTNDRLSHPNEIWQLVEPINGATIKSVDLIPGSSVAWTYDSSRFVAEIGQEDTNHYFAIFDHEGEMMDKIYHFPQDRTRAFDPIDHDSSNIQWSLSNRYLAFVVSANSYPFDFRLYIADVDAKKVIDTCIASVNGLAWSQDSTQMALLGYNNRGNLPIQIFDLSAWKLYTVAYHDGSIIGWRTND